MLVQDRRFDVFLSHSSADDPAVERIAERLRGEGIQLWLDTWRLRPGDDWQQEISRGLRSSDACAVFVGSHGLGVWAREELRIAQSRAARDHDFRLFMVLLPGAPNPDDPSLAFLATRTWADLRAGIDDPSAFQDLIRAITDRPTHLDGTHEDVCPYRGLEVFDEKHAEFFFGRDHDIRRVVEKLRDSRFLAVLGPSGCGKSSLVRAGVIPALERGDLPGSEAWTVRLITPTARPLIRLAVQLAQLFPQEARESRQRTLDQLRADEQNLDQAAALAFAERPADERLMLVVDQFEEVFTLCDDEADRTAFVANLCSAATIPGGRVVVLLAMRADFYHRCADDPQLAALMDARQFLVSPLTADGLRQAIERPAWRVDLRLQAGLVETILGDVADRPGMLPLLEYALREVWQRRHGRMLTLEAYVAAGEVEGALAQRANAIYKSLTSAQQQIARRVLLRLIQPGEGTEDTRRRARMDELSTRAEEKADVEAVVTALADGRLLATGQDEVTKARVVDVSHVAMIRGWPELGAWIEENRELLRAHRRLTEVASEWEANEQDETFLYGGIRLAAWQDRPLEDLNDLERAFLAASREREARERSARRRRIRLTVAGLSAALAVISALAVLALVQRNQALSRQLAANATAQLSIDPELSILLAREAFEVRPTREAEAVLRQAVLESRVRETLRGHNGPVSGVAFSPDGQRLASAGDDGTVRIWDLAGDADPTVLSGHNGTVRGVAFSPDGQRLASTGDDGTVRIWDLAGGADPTVLRGHNGQVRDVAFSPDGQRLASTGNDGTVRIWDLAGGADPIVLRGHNGTVRGVAFSPDGQRLASAGFDGTVRVWQAAGDANPAVLSGHNGRVFGVAFSADGQRVASAGEDSTVRIWNLAGGADPIVIRGHNGEVFGVTFSSDGQRVASASDDGTVRIWDLAGGADPVILRGHNGPVFGITLSPDGQRVAAGGADGTVRIWNLAGGADPIVIRGHNGQVFGVTFSTDGQRIAAGGADGTVRVWQTAGGADSVLLRGHNGTVGGVAFSPDGQQLASAGDDGTVRIWDPRGGADSIVLHGHNGAVGDVAFSPDGRGVASAGADGTVRVWQTVGGADPVILHGHRGPARDVAFSPDGKQLASPGNDGTVRIWDLAGGADPIVLRGHNGPVVGVAFSPDGKQLASTGIDAAIRVWQTAGRADPMILRGHNGPVVRVAFSPDGKRLASASLDGTVRVWTCEVCGPIEEVLALGEERITRELTCEEHATFLHGPPCP